MKGFSILPIFVGVVVAFIAVIALVIALFIFVVSVISLNFFGAGGIEVIGFLNTPYVVANTLAHSEINGHTILEPVLAASVAKLDAATLSKVSAKIKELLDSYDFSYSVQLEGIDLLAACTKAFDSKHKAVDIAASCGAPAKARCGGRLSTIGPGLSGDAVFAGKSFDGSQGLRIEHDDKCDIPELRGYMSFYGCIEIPDTRARPVRRAEIIGYVGTCKAEPGDCHLHYGITKGALSDAEDPKICNSVDNVLQHGTNVLARKGEIEDVSAEASIPLLFKDKTSKLVVTIGER